MQLMDINKYYNIFKKRVNVYFCKIFKLILIFDFSYFSFNDSILFSINIINLAKYGKI